MTAETDSQLIDCAAMIPPLPFDPDTSACGAECSGAYSGFKYRLRRCAFARKMTRAKRRDGEMPETETTAAATDNDAHQTAAFIGGGMVVVGGLVWYLSGGSFAAVDFSPDFNYAISESGYSVNAGGRADFRKNSLAFILDGGTRKRQRRFRRFSLLHRAANTKRIFGRRRFPKKYRAKSRITMYRCRRTTAKVFGSCRRFTACIPALKKRKTAVWKAKQRTR